MRITMLVHGRISGDSGSRRAATALVEAGHDVTLVGWQPSPWVASLASLVRGIRAYPPDAIHVLGAAMLVPALIARRLTGAAVVYESHESARRTRFRRAVEAVAIPRCAATILDPDIERVLGVYHRIAARDEIRLQRLYAGYLSSEAKRRAWASDNLGNQAIRQELLARILAWSEDRLRDGAELLDVGCGAGWLLRALAERGVDPARLTGIDEVAERARRAQANVPAATVLHGDAASLPFAAESFDLVTLVTALSSVRRSARPAVLDESARVLRPGGLMLIYEARFPNPLNRATRTVSLREVRVARLRIVGRESLTVVPALARRLGPRTPRAYRLLAQLPVLRSHRLIVAAPEGVRPSRS